MHHIIKSFIILTAFTLLTACQNMTTALSESEKAVIAKTIYTKSGLESSIGNIPEQMAQQLYASPTGQIPESVANSMLESFQEAFNDDTGQEMCQQYFQNNLADADLLALDKWFNTSLGEQISAAELAMNAVRTEEEIAEIIEQAGQASSDRMQQVTSLLFDTGLADMIKNIMTNVAIASGTSIFKSIAPTEMQTEEQLSGFIKMLTNQANMQATAMNGMMMSIYAWGYRDISNAHLQEYIELLKSSVGQTLIHGTGSCIDDLFLNFNDIFTGNLEAQADEQTKVKI